MKEEEILAAAQVAHEANRAYCLTIGDDSQKSWEDAGAWQKQSSISGVRSAIMGLADGPESQHKLWMDEKLADGWTYGEVKDPVAKTHPCLVLYEQLPPEQRRKDVLFRAVAMAFAVPL